MLGEEVGQGRGWAGILSIIVIKAESSVGLRCPFPKSDCFA